MPQPLASFRAALDELDRGKRREPVRVLWLGDSHTAADYLTGAVRAALWERHAPGGPGFLRVGLKAHRHDQASVVRTGRFLVEPAPAARRTRQGDGVFGLGGMRASPLSTRSSVSVKLVPEAMPAMHGRVRFSVLYELPARAAFMVELGARRVRVPADAEGRAQPGSPIARLELEADAGERLELRSLRGQPRFYGVIAESASPGVVLDTLGINGARVATALAWDAPTFSAEVAARNPSLVVVAYGTNEAFDALDVRAYSGELESLLGRLRKGAPGASCLVLGPPDALDPAGAPAPRVQTISAVYVETAAREGCAYVSAQALMGGPGAFRQWLTEKPELARPDRIHLTAAGYRLLGARIAAELGEPALNSP